MSLKNRGVGHRAWNLLRVSLLWARKGGVLRRRVAMELRLVPKYLKRLGHTTQPTHIHYFERELSFDKTPIFHVKMYRPSSMRFHLPHIPCINPHVDFDYDFNDDNDDNVEYGYDNGRKSALIDQEFNHGYEGWQETAYGGEEEEADAQGIDERAEEFIAKFHQQMKLQRQISLLQYNETHNRDRRC
ncbi:uncharacterized protein LOC113873702 [Abrus precatorius]|uniref:Uncharacterized protein LOC113873702 n=1 Tax=Abrus precatorius TaxID=3816 RepID=A0A8B8MGB9_ABRPR|nr:uncharacterized protein LOC113873702 [Abrus precatorius]